jgi:hypothetical protein
LYGVEGEVIPVTYTKLQAKQNAKKVKGKR